MSLVAVVGDLSSPDALSIPLRCSLSSSPFYLLTATEAHDDDGLPHTLEHLIFLGSEDMPYKGILDLVANRCLSSGTNAWTDTDHTW